MKTTRTVIFIACGLLPCGSPAEYSIIWHSTGAGGGECAGGEGGAYSLNGSISQSGAGEQTSGGTFAAAGGYWTVVTVQIPGEPRLSIGHNPNTGMITVFWPSQFNTHVLEQSPDLTAGSWTDSTYTVTDDGVVRSITFSPEAGKWFFRLSD